MKIVFTFRIKTAFKEKLEQKFPDTEFVYATSISEVSIEDADVIATEGIDLTEAIVEKATALNG